MAWTNPRTWVSLETVTAALLNTHVRDNFKAIGDAYTAYTPTLAGTGGGGSVGNGTITGFWRQTGKHTDFYGTLTLGSTTSLGTGVTTFSLPATAARARACGESRLFDTSASTNQAGALYIETGALTVCRVLYGTGSVSATTPWTWATGDILMFSGAYDAA